MGRYPPDDAGIAEAVEQIAGMNAHRQNAYACVNPILADAVIPAGKAAKDEDVAAAFFHFADGDDPKAADRIKSFVGPKPGAYVVTGTVPHTRPHVDRPLEEPTRNLKAWTETQKGIAAALGTDPTVVNPSRIMRVAGSVCWPTPKKPRRATSPRSRGFTSMTVRRSHPRTCVGLSRRPVRPPHQPRQWTP